MEVEKFRGYVTAAIAAVLCLLSLLLAVWAWAQPIDATNPRDLAVLFGLFGTVFGAASGWLFGTESAARASHAAERSFSSGAITGAQVPQQIVTGTTGTTDDVEP